MKLSVDQAGPENNERKRPRILPAVLAVAVGGCLIGSAFIVGRSAAVSVLSSAGVAILLFLPLYWIQDRSYRAVRRVATQQAVAAAAVTELARNIDAVQEEVRTTNLRIDELGSETRRLIQEERQHDTDTVERFRAGPTWKTTADLFHSALRLDAIGPHIACRLGTSYVWMFFATAVRPARSINFYPTIEVYLDVPSPDGQNLDSVS